MKRIILLFSSILIMFSCSYAGTPPTTVMKSFEKKFPTATKVSWGKEGAKEWEAEFTLDGNKISANFGLDGKWLETETEIPIKSLPKGVTDAITSKYPGWVIKEADKTETAKHGLIYEADIKSGSQKKEVAYKEDGTPVVE